MPDPRFDRYADTSALERARTIQQDADALSPKPAPNDGRPSYEPGISVIVLNLDKPELIIPLVAQLKEQRQAFRDSNATLQILIGDTGSKSPEVLEAYDQWAGDVLVARGLTYHFSRCNNEMSRRATCDHLLFLNNDVILPHGPTALFDLYRTFHEASDVGILGSVLYFPNDVIQHCGVHFLLEPPRRALPFHPHAGEKLAPDELPECFETPATTGSFLLIRRSLFNRLHGFSHHYAIEAQDVDLCLRAHRIGYRVRIANLGKVVHLENATRPRGEEHWRDRRLFLRRWSSYVEANFL